MTDTLVDINSQQTIVSDSLAADTLVGIKDTLSFFNVDGINQFNEAMPIFKISDLNIMIPAVENWFSFIFLALMVYLIIIKFLYSFSFSENLKALMKIQSIDTIGFQKENINSGYLLFPVSIFVLSFYLYFLINPYFLHLELDFLFLVFAGLVSFVFLIKHLVEYLLAMVFGTRKMFKKYYNDNIYMLGISSLVQLPFLGAYIYNGSEVFLWFSVLIISILWGVRLFRSFVIGLKETNFSNLYIILYLCSLEILPLLMAYKWLIL